MLQCHVEVSSRLDVVDDVDFLLEVQAGSLNHPQLLLFSAQTSLLATAAAPESVDAKFFQVAKFRRSEVLRLPRILT